MFGASRATMSYAEYLVAEERSLTKHEYLRGEVFAMAGGTIEHSLLAANLIHELRQLIGDRPCVVLTSDARVRVAATDLSTYPDVSVVCGPVETAHPDPNAILNPTLVAEVLSDSTEAYDRGEKAAHYRHIPSLREYLLVSQRATRIEVYRREGELWVFSEAGAGASIQLASVGGALPVDAVYRNPTTR